MDDWHRRIAIELVAETPGGLSSASEGATALEIALGEVRSTVAYVLELARAHRLAAVGNVSGDAVWLQLGDARLRATLNRREGHVVWAVLGRDPAHLRWDAAKRAIVEDNGARVDVVALARETIDGMLTAWRARLAAERRPSAHLDDFEDEPTKG
jgi:hypothetical protein